MIGPSPATRTRTQRHEVEWKPKLSIDAPTRPEDVPTRFRGITLRRGRRSRPEALPASTWIVVITVLLAMLGLGWQLLAS